MAFPREYTQKEQTNVDVCVSRQGQTKNVVWMKNLNQSVLIIGIRLMTFWGTVQGTREGSRNKLISMTQVKKSIFKQSCQYIASMYFNQLPLDKKHPLVSLAIHFRSGRKGQPLML